MNRLIDKVAIVTGGTSGIGRACSELFAREGAMVVIAGRRRELGEAVVKSIGGKALFVRTDVTTEADIKALIERTLERFGRLDCVVSSAGSGSSTSSIAKTDWNDFEADIALHVRAAFFAMKFASPSMIRQGAGSFINIASVSAHRAGFNAFGYEVAKAALLHLTRCAALELGEKGVRVNSISPGPTLTGIFWKRRGEHADDADARATKVEEAFRKVLPSVQALPGMIHAFDIARAALFLASDEARYVNGHDLVVDGGICAGQPASVRAASWKTLRDHLGD